MKEETKEDTDRRIIDVSSIDLVRMKEKTAEFPGLLPYAHTVGGVPIAPEDRGKIKGRAMSAMYQQTDRQMKQLYDQMQALLDQAQHLKRRVSISERIYEAEMRSEPLVGQIYYLYQKKDDTDLLSMVSPPEWGRKIPFKAFLAEAQLLADHTWDIISYSEDFSHEQ